MAFFVPLFLFVFIMVRFLLLLFLLLLLAAACKLAVAAQDGGILNKQLSPIVASELYIVNSTR